MEDYKPNSHASKEEQKGASNPAPKKKFEKVVTGTTKAKKKSEAHKLLDIFLPEDITSVKSYILYEDIMKGGNLTFVMGNTPNKAFGAAPENRPKTAE